MDNPIILKAKKRVFTEAVQGICDNQNLPMPEINFDGVDDGGGDELAHSHPELYKICISERQLKLQNSVGLRETAYHEMTHLIGLIGHGRQFENIKNELMQKGWKPPGGSGVQFISGAQVLERSKRIRDDPERYAWVNEDSDYVKFVEGRTKHYENESIKQDAGADVVKIPKKNKRKTKKGRKVRVIKMSNQEIEKTDRKKKEKKLEEEELKKDEIRKRILQEEERERLQKMDKEEKLRSTQKMSEVKIKESRSKLGIDMEYVPEYKPKSSSKRKGFFDKIKDALGIN